jgi:hypothetical protein
MEQVYIYIAVGVVVLISIISILFSGSNEKKDEKVDASSNLQLKLQTTELLNKDITLAGSVSSSGVNSASAPGIKNMSVKSSNEIDIVDQK